MIENVNVFVNQEERDLNFSNVCSLSAAVMLAFHYFKKS
ncbi:MAG: hypothetical protein BWY15_01714 [Firmicutes bacterium ADurb.Bin193]|nr:MAG: hypothetical protein BWY15_01714 [Firmicutes bacterium ADurb.Bin193]